MFKFKKVTPLCLIVFAFGCLALLPNAEAVSPPPDGGYPGGNTAEGDLALQSLTTGFYNNAVGIYALLSVTTGNFNTANGAGALFSITTTSENTATGAGALFSNSGGFSESANTADGAFALFSDTTGFHNTAVGDRALFANTTGQSNVAVGDGALGEATGGLVQVNTVVGSGVGGSLTTGSGNVFVGAAAGNDFLSGDFNICIGYNAAAGGVGINSASGNVFIGALAAQNFTAGDNNTCIGNGAGPGGVSTIGAGNVFIGATAGNSITDGDNNICIGNAVLGEAGAANSTYIGNINTTAQPIVGGVDGVTVDLTTGKLGHGVSSRRFKEQIKPMDTASEALYALKPVTFHYNKAIDPTQTLDFGLIAEEVAAVNPELAVRDREGKISNYRHDAVNAMLLNEFLKEHKKVEEQQATIAALKSTVAQQQKGFESKLAKQEEQIETLTAGLQKVSAQLEVNKGAAQTVLNNR